MSNSVEIPTFYVMVGIPGSGKSVHTQRLVRDHKNSIIINEENYYCIDYEATYQRIKSALSSGKYEYVVYDAVNVESKRRMALLNEIRHINCWKVAVVMATPFEVCLRNNWCREKRASNNDIHSMYMRWHTPAYFEGWDNIRVQLWNEMTRRNAYYHWMSTLRFANYNQGNPHHQESLGNHLISVGRYVEEHANDENLTLAAYLHDIGKPYTRVDGDDGIAHYFCHENVGAYDVLCAGYNLEISLLINYHMRPLFWEASSNYNTSCDKYKSLWGEDFFNKIMLLREADTNAR